MKMEIRDYIAAISASLALFALYLNNYYANQRERRKELRDRLDKVNLYIESLREKSFKFFTEAYSTKNSEELLYSFETLYRMLQTIHYLSDEERVGGAYTNYKKSVTLDNFDKSSFIVQTDDSEILREIYYNSEILIERLEDVYIEKFPFRIRFSVRKVLGY